MKDIKNKNVEITKKYLKNNIKTINTSIKALTTNV